MCIRDRKKGTKLLFLFAVIFLMARALGIKIHDTKKFNQTPTAIIFPKSITGLISLKIRDKNPTAVVKAA